MTSPDPDRIIGPEISRRKRLLIGFGAIALFIAVILIAVFTAGTGS